MQLPIYIFSAKQGMQWLSGASADVVRLDNIRKRIGKLVDFDAGEAPYRGILADNEVCYVYACFLAPRFDFRGRDATYFIFTEVPKSAWNTFNFDTLLRSELFTIPCSQITEGMTFDGGRFIQPFVLNTTQQDFIGANYWLKHIPANTEIRFHQEGDLSATITYSERQIVSPCQNAFPQSCTSESRICVNEQDPEVNTLKQKIEILQQQECQLLHTHQAAQKALELKLQQSQLENQALKQTIKDLKQKNRSLTQTVEMLTKRSRSLSLGLITIVILFFLLILGVIVYHYTPLLTQPETMVVLEPELQEFVDE